MTLFSMVGTLAQPGSTGNQSVGSIGFQPKIVLFWATGHAGTGSGASASWFFGAATSSTDRRVTTGAFADGGVAAPCNGGQDAAKCISFSIPGGSGTNYSQADFVTMDAGGFTINWTSVDATARSVNWLAIGGTDVTNVKTGSIFELTGTGSQATSGLGFKPDAVLFFNGRTTTTAPPTYSQTTIRPRIGMATGASETGEVAGLMVGGAPGNAQSYQRTDKVYANIDTVGLTIFAEAELTSLDTDGFTLNWTTGSGTASYLFWIAIKGADMQVGSLLQPTSTGAQAITGLGTAPSAVMLLSDGFEAQTTLVSSVKLSMGAGSDSTHRATAWWGASNGANPTNVSSDQSAASIIRMLTEGHGTPTLLAEADLTSLDASGFTLNWGTVDSTQRQVLYLAIGVASSVVPGPVLSGSQSGSHIHLSWV